MATLNQLAYSFAQIKERENDPQFIELSRFNYIHYRSLFIRRDQERNKILPTKAIQSIICEMVVVKASELPGVTMGVELSRTRDPLPSVVRLKTRDAFEFIGGVDGIEVYSAINAREAQYVQQAQFTKHIPRVYYKRGNLYVTNKNPTKILVEAIFEDPTKLDKYLTPSGDLAYTEDMDFPLPDDMIQGITLGMISGELKFLMDQQPNEIKVNV